MNKTRKFEKFVNKKNINNNNRKDISNNYGRNYQYSKTMDIYRKNNTYKNTIYKNTYSNKIKSFQSYKQNPKITQGMYSYKRNINNPNNNLSNSYESKNITKINSSEISNKLNINTNKNHLLFPNLKLNIDNTETSSLRTLTNNDNISNNFPLMSPINLNKYKIVNEPYNKNKSIDMGNTFNNTNYNYDFLKYNNIIINNIQQQPKYKPRSNEIININSKRTSKHNSFQYNNINENLNNINSNYNYNINTIKSSNIIEQGIKINNYFVGKNKYEKESRRMIIEYLKILKIQENNKSKINNILKNNNISYKVLNQKKIIYNINTYPNQSLSYSNVSAFNNKNIESPRKKYNIKNINKFLNDMNDITNAKINMIKFLSLPRIMDLIFMEKKYKYIFMLVPNQFSYQKGIESYIYQWKDIKTRQLIGGFDLIKINSCCINYQNDKNVLIETFDGVYHRQYELITISNDIASNYVKSINYLSRLEKCKIYNKKYLCN